jgi:hypothetical protein
MGGDRKEDIVTKLLKENCKNNFEEREQIVDTSFMITIFIKMIIATKQ